MPRKSGYECLAEIKQDPRLMHIPVIIYSTALNLVDVDSLYKTGAHYYIQKPGDFGDLSNAIGHVLNLPEEKRRIQPERSDFLLFHKKRHVMI
jgi:CheY-like chemotaxis protein